MKLGLLRSYYKLSFNDLEKVVLNHQPVGHIQPAEQYHPICGDPQESINLAQGGNRSIKCCSQAAKCPGLVGSHGLDNIAHGHSAARSRHVATSRVWQDWAYMQDHTQERTPCSDPMWNPNLWTDPYTTHMAHRARRLGTTGPEKKCWKLPLPPFPLTYPSQNYA